MTHLAEEPGDKLEEGEEGDIDEARLGNEEDIEEIHEDDSGVKRN